MGKSIYETIIVGGGISALSCARKLCDEKKDFLIISPNIGGRIKTSEYGNVNYGAYLASSYYKETGNYLKKTRAVSLFSLELHMGKESYAIFSWKLFKYNLELLRFLKVLFRFKREYSKIRKKEPYISQKKLILDSPILKRWYSQPAEEFVKEYKIENIVRNILIKPMHAISFASLPDANAFGFLHAALLLCSDMHEFNFLFEKIVKGFERSIYKDEVLSICPGGEGYEIKTNLNKTFYAKNLVLAVPISVSKKLLSLKKINKLIRVHMYHINGEIRKKYSKKDFQLFSPKSDLDVIARQHDGTYLVYTRYASKLKSVFSRYDIIKHIYWDPAYSMPGPHLQEQNIGNNCILAGDFNLMGIEDSFLSGLYAANKILRKTLD